MVLIKLTKECREIISYLAEAVQIQAQLYCLELNMNAEVSFTDSDIINLCPNTNRPVETNTDVSAKSIRMQINM